MPNLFIVLFMLVAFVFILYKLGLLNKNIPFLEKMEEENPFDLVVKGKIFTNTELKFFNELNKLVNNEDYFLFTKVRLVDLVEIKKAEYNKYMSIFNKLSKKHIDFVIVDKYGRVEVLIELDDKYHKNNKAQVNDEFKNELLLYLDIPLIRYNAGKDYNFDDIKKRLVCVN